jgi:hypothetical protein
VPHQVQFLPKIKYHACLFFASCLSPVIGALKSVMEFGIQLEALCSFDILLLEVHSSGYALGVLWIYLVKEENQITQGICVVLHVAIPSDHRIEDNEVLIIESSKFQWQFSLGSDKSEVAFSTTSHGTVNPFAQWLQSIFQMNYHDRVSGLESVGKLGMHIFTRVSSIIYLLFNVPASVYKRWCIAWTSFHMTSEEQDGLALFHWVIAWQLGIVSSEREGYYQVSMGMNVLDMQCLRYKILVCLVVGTNLRVKPIELFLEDVASGRYGCEKFQCIIFWLPYYHNCSHMRHQGAEDYSLHITKFSWQLIQFLVNTL